MNGAHDVGGMVGLGPVPTTEKAGLFEHDWERRTFGLTLGTIAQALYNIDENRYARECMEPAAYLASGYYEQWFAALETNLVDRGVITHAELDERGAEFVDGQAAPAALELKPELMDAVRDAIQNGGAPQRNVRRPARFAVGARVRTCHPSTNGHTRLPRYARGRVGVVERVCGGYSFPDANAHDLGEQPQHVYTVRFAARELWGEAAEANHTLSLEAWDEYLEPAPD
jgi:nitrile hydratase beta subunit